jgi:hypothetical protein
MLTRSSPTKTVGTVLFGQVIDGTLNPPIADGAVVFFKGGKTIDLAPPAPIKRWYFEKHKIFLNGLFTYDEQTGGHLVN